MNNLFNQSDVADILKRMEKLSPDTTNVWGKMNVAQMMAHCTKSLETASGVNVINRVFIGRIIGTLMRSKVLSEKPFGKNSPTDTSYIFREELNFSIEKQRLIEAIHNFYEGGPAKCTTYAHPFFGKFKSEEWAVFEWKHLDHHFRQFAV